MSERDVLERYLELIETFTSGETSASDFSLAYLDEFKTEEGGLSEQTFWILHDLFAACDMYCEDPALRGELDLDEDELLDAAREAEARIEERLEREYGDR